MKTLFIVIVLLLTVCGGCGLLDSDSDWIVEKMYTREVEIPSHARLGEPIVFTVKSQLYNSCWEFSHLQIASSEFDIYITPYMKQLIKERACAEVITGVTEEGVFTPVFPGEHRFHFWRSDTLTLEYVVVVR